MDTAETLTGALLEYRGTVIFTSHDRHFTGRVATSVVEVRDGRVTSYVGRYDDYLHRVNKEVEAGERSAAEGHARGGRSGEGRPARPDGGRRRPARS